MKIDTQVHIGDGHEEMPSCIGMPIYAIDPPVTVREKEDLEKKRKLGRKQSPLKEKRLELRSLLKDKIQSREAMLERIQKLDKPLDSK